jgi:hypothetical protein
MNIRKIASMTAAAVLASAAAVAGCASAAAPAATTARAAPARAVTTASAGGATRIMAYSVNSDGPDFRAIMTGAVGDYGPAVTVYPDGKVDPEHTSELELNLSHGSFRLSIARLDAEVVRAYRRWPSSAATCSGSITVAAPAPVVAGSGTGAYRGIAGRFSMTVTIDEVDVKPVCNGTGKFLSQVILMAGAGTVSY